MAISCYSTSVGSKSLASKPALDNSLLKLVERLLSKDTSFERLCVYRYRCVWHCRKYHLVWLNWHPKPVKLCELQSYQCLPEQPG